VIRAARLSHTFVAIAVWASAGAVAQSPPSQPDFRGGISGAITYQVSLAGFQQHLVRVRIKLGGGFAQRDVQLPVWNALYQVRDFSQYVNWVRARNLSGQPLPVSKLDKTTWRIADAAGGAEVEYEIFADQPGPYGAQLNAHHAFFNLAEILMYPVNGRQSPAGIWFTEVPTDWNIATALPGTSQTGFSADDYDRLVDCPVEIGSFQEADFDQGGVHYRVVVDAIAADYDMQKIVPVVQRIVAATTAWMDDRPPQTYLFLYHFPRATGGGGMEHADSTAIDVNARVLDENPLALADVTAHEFFHVWNVKRIRPQSLEPVDYTKENYTTALWFSEGVTNTVEDYILLRAGLLGEPLYLRRLSDEISELERRPAHLTQSAEASSLNAWLEKYPSYRLPERSISYYEKGQLLGVMLDLSLRDATHGSESLRDLFRWMNQNYARQGRYFEDSDGIRQAAEAVSHADFKAFFQEYVAGAAEIPWDDVFSGVGLTLVRYTRTVPNPGFQAARNFDAPPIVTSIDSKSEAQQTGLAVGNSILEINGQVASVDFLQKLAELAIGDTLRLRVPDAAGERELHWKVGSREEVEFELKDVDNITAKQKARRAAWLKGESQ
jgi:predicted metalloprotease with PDZ domain